MEGKVEKMKRKEKKRWSDCLSVCSCVLCCPSMRGGGGLDVGLLGEEEEEEEGKKYEGGE